MTLPERSSRTATWVHRANGARTAGTPADAPPAVRCSRSQRTPSVRPTIDGLRVGPDRRSQRHWHPGPGSRGRHPRRAYRRLGRHPRGVRRSSGDGGYFGSTNTDTEDLQENVSYALAFQAVIAASTHSTIPSFAGSRMRRAWPRSRFELRDDNGEATKGCCSWRMPGTPRARGRWQRWRRPTSSPSVTNGSVSDALKALTILRAMAKHHHGAFGFLTEAVDWDGHSTAVRHFPGERYGDIVTTATRS